MIKRQVGRLQGVSDGLMGASLNQLYGNSECRLINFWTLGMLNMFEPTWRNSLAYRRGSWLDAGADPVSIAIARDSSL